jgi:hypothetical protein
MTPEPINVAPASGALAPRVGQPPCVGGDFGKPFRQGSLAPRQRCFQSHDDSLGHRDAAALRQSARELGGSVIPNVQGHRRFLLYIRYRICVYTFSISPCAVYFKLLESFANAALPDCRPFDPLMICRGLR